MRIPSGVTDQVIYFVAVDATDLKTRETGLTAFTVYRSRNGGAPAAFTTPTVTEVDATNMPGVYKLLLDEDMTIGAGNDSEEFCVHITQAAMAPVTRTFELYRPKITAGNTLDVTATGAAGIDWSNVENPGATVDLAATGINLVDTCTANTDMRGTDNAALAAVCTEARLAELDAANLPSDVAAVKTDTAAVLADTADMQPKLGSPAVDLAADIAANATHLTDIKGATFSGATDSLEALRDRGDAAWITGAGGTPPQLLQSTTIASLTSQTVFTLTAGSADDTAYDDALIVVTDQVTAEQKAFGIVSAYVGATKQVTLDADPGVFTMAVGDTVDIIAVPRVIAKVTTNADMRGTDGAALATVCTEARLAELDAANLPSDVAAVLADTADMQPKIGTPAADLAADVAAVKSETAAILADTADIQPKMGTPAVSVSADLAAVKAETASILADTADMQPKIGTPAVSVSADLAAVKADTAAVLVDTADMQPKLGSPAGASLAADIAAIKADTAAILVDTNELQGDWTNGGRLDLILDAINAATGSTGVVLTAAERNAIADAMLDRDMSSGTDSGSTTVRTVRQALRAARNKVSIAGGTLTVYKEDDVTASWTAAVTTTAGDPISTVDPA